MEQKQDSMTTGLKEQTTFHLTFFGQEVTITTTANTNLSVNDAHSSTVNNLPLFYEGILMDYDDLYYYLGNGTEIEQAVVKAHVLHLMITSDNKVYDEILKQMPTPDKNEIN